MATKEWRMPKKSEVLIYDNNGADLLLEYINKNQSSILHTRGEYINILVLFLSRFNIKSYIDIYIKLSGAKFVVTMTDNTISFYSLKNRHPNTVFIFLQNGVRGLRGDIFPELINNNKKMFVDYMFTFNQSIGFEYSKYISGKTVTIGSLKNNYHTIENLNKKHILFVSQYTNVPNNGADSHFQSANNISVSWNNVYEAERRVLEFLSSYCNDNNLKLKIAGRLSSSDLEYEFYNANITNLDNWEFLPKDSNTNVYKLVDQSQFIVGIDSTLLYESFARGKRVAFFSCRGEVLGANVGHFAWPADLKESGPFWASYINIDELTRVMDYIMHVSENEWMEQRSLYCNFVMEYDSGNTKLVSLFKDIKLPINKKHV